MLIELDTKRGVAPLTVMLLVVEGTNGFVERWKPSRGPVNVKLTIGLLSLSSGMIYVITNDVLVVVK